jgi:hypothetical protein
MRPFSNTKIVSACITVESRCAIGIAMSAPAATAPDMGILRCRKLNPDNDLADAALHSWSVRAQAQQ